MGSTPAYIAVLVMVSGVAVATIANTTWALLRWGRRTQKDQEGTRFGDDSEQTPSAVARIVYADHTIEIFDSATAAELLKSFEQATPSTGLKPEIERSDKPED